MAYNLAMSLEKKEDQFGPDEVAAACTQHLDETACMRIAASGSLQEAFDSAFEELEKFGVDPEEFFVSRGMLEFPESSDAWTPFDIAEICLEDLDQGTLQRIASARTTTAALSCAFDAFFALGIDPVEFFVKKGVLYTGVEGGTPLPN